ncbi:CsgG/HfaB family protein [Verrucomicrobiota bacterium]
MKIRNVTPGGAEITIVESTDPPPEQSSKPAEATTTTARGQGVDAESHGERGGPGSGTPDGPHKARLAVLPAVFSTHFEPKVEFAEKITISGNANLELMFTSEYERRLEASSFTVSLVEAFVASRKFEVMERSRLQETLQEVDFGESDYADSANVVPLGCALNAEYVVLPEIEVIHLVAEAKEIPYVDRVRPRFRAKMIARARVVHVGTTRVVAALTEEVQVERLLKPNNTFLGSEIHNAVIDMYGAESQRIVHRTLEAIYPVKILDVLGDKVVLNRGEGSIKEGDEFDVYVMERAYTDPDTGENLGAQERRVGKIRVQRSMPKMSEAAILEGVAGIGEAEDALVCRETAESVESKTRLTKDRLPW